MTALNLNAIEFTRVETLIVDAGAISVFAFRYASGVAALRVCNKVGEIIFLPFHGQQIWDASFYGRRLTMRSMFDEPVNSRNYLENYGGYLLHCGATAMGNPGPQDNHPVHGELPNAAYQTAELTIGENYVELSGTYRHTIAFSHNYYVEPRLRIYADHGRMEMDFKIHNLKADAMDVMYLAHVNFRPQDGARIVDTVPDVAKYFNIRDRIPEFFGPKPDHATMVKSLKKNPALHRIFMSDVAIDPELVMGLTFKCDSEGYAHSMQILEDGTADFISHRPRELQRGVRWITRTANQDALGLYLPGTAEADGYLAEKAKGNMVSIAAGENFHCAYHFGALTQAEAALQQKLCAKIVASQ
jgi:Domain of unknown function (DUF4432)